MVFLLDVIITKVISLHLNRYVNIISFTFALSSLQAKIITLGQQ